MTTDELERRLRRHLTEALDRQAGPHAVWVESPTAQRVATLDRRSGRWPLRVMGIAALIGALGGAALLTAALPDRSTDDDNGWVAFTVEQEHPAGGGRDKDVWIASLEQPARRVIGNDTDGVDQLCPAFSPDGRRLAYGRVEGLSREPDVDAWRKSALVIADVADDGTVVDRFAIDVGDELPPPCAVWSSDQAWVAFGVPRTSPINPDHSADGSEVWVVRLSDRNVTVLPDLLATDLEWSPDGSHLAIAGGRETASGVGVTDGPQDDGILLYAPSSGSVRSLPGTRGVRHVTWSPDGRHIAFASRGLRSIDVETGTQAVLSASFGAIHGIGPVWSPDGETIAYQRRVGPSGERHEVVLLTPDDRSAETGLASQVAMPMRRTIGEAPDQELFPWRVTWSPDSRYLLQVAWTYPNGCCGEGTVEQALVVAVPADPGAPAVVLADVEGIVPYDADDATMRVPIQSWGRR